MPGVGLLVGRARSRCPVLEPRVEAQCAAPIKQPLRSPAMSGQYRLVPASIPTSPLALDPSSPRAPAGMQSPKLPEIQELGLMLGRVAGDTRSEQSGDLDAFDRAEEERRRKKHEENTRRAQVALERRRSAQQGRKHDAAELVGP